MKRFCLLALGFSSLLPFANAQDVPNKHVRFMTLGELHRWEASGPSEHGIIKQKEIPKGAQPPSAVRYSTGGEVKPLRLPLREFSQYATLNGSDESLLLTNIDSDGGGEFLKSPVPTGTMNLGVLIPNPQTMNWTEPKILMLKDDARSFPVGEIRFVNASDRTVLVKIEGHPPFGVKAGASSRKTLKDIGSFKGGKFVKPLDERTFMKVGFRDSKNVDHELYSNNLNISKGTRIQCFFFKSKGEGSAKDVRFVLVPEEIPSVPRPPRRRSR